MKVIKRKNLPSHLPVVGTLVWYLFLKDVGAPEWFWGIAIAVGLALWIGAIYNLVKAEEVDIFPAEPTIRSFSSQEVYNHERR